MITPINISCLKTTNEVYAKCDKCGWEAFITLKGRTLNTDNDSEITALDYEYDKCGTKL